MSSRIILELVADGEPHRLVDLARATFRRADAEAIARVVTELEGLRALGLAWAIASSTVQAEPIILLDRAAIARHLDQAPTPWTVQVEHCVDSTNSDLMAAVRGDARPLPIVLTAEIQRAGRGRLGRAWSSAIGASLTASFALRLRRPLSDLDGVTLVCGLALQQVFVECGVPARVKWPNDIVVDDRKLAGILVEACVKPNGRDATTILVVGVGVNVQPPTSDADAAPANPLQALSRTSLSEHGAPRLDRNAWCARIALALERELSVFETNGFAAFARRWNDADAYHDRDVALAGDGAEYGIARGVDDRGALLIDIGGARRRFVAGDVSLRPAMAAHGRSAA